MTLFSELVVPVVDLLIPRRASTQSLALRIMNPLPIPSHDWFRKDAPIDQWLVVLHIWADIHRGVVRTIGSG
jgi:hypothetical protein